MPFKDGYRLVYAGRDYPIGGTAGDDLQRFVKLQRLSKKRPGVVRCETCKVYSSVWGWKQVSGFAEKHAGHNFSLDARQT